MFFGITKRNKGTGLQDNSRFFSKAGICLQEDEQPGSISTKTRQMDHCLGENFNNCYCFQDTSAAWNQRLKFIRGEGQSCFDVVFNMKKSKENEDRFWKALPDSMLRRLKGNASTITTPCLRIP